MHDPSDEHKCVYNNWIRNGSALRTQSFYDSFTNLDLDAFFVKQIYQRQEIVLEVDSVKYLYYDLRFYLR